ncbi:hypothetical protein KIN20_007567 [Parelaphostrongylus tenuis]|uniref:Uncharacterized protein n=1 Tax=Parelaphostrongylus tenuis TaxID=148309 RepID=A0AAD5QJ97_PARTN|nr:hypothetical protein KIN20_007567 [Parelaphostrongylus tenuis]
MPEGCAMYLSPMFSLSQVRRGAASHIHHVVIVSQNMSVLQLSSAELDENARGSVGSSTSTSKISKEMRVFTKAKSSLQLVSTGQHTSWKHMNRADTKKMDCTLLKLTSTTLRNEGIVMVHVVSCVVLNTVAMTNLLETSWSNSRVDKSRCRFET